jgi:hypothetical protein
MSLLFFAAVFGLAGIVSAESAKHPSLTVTNDSYDFGFIPIDYRVSYTYYIKNTGTEILNIDRVISNCDCTSSQLLRKRIPPGDSAELNIIFHTLNYYGRTTRTLTVHSNDPVKPEFDISYTAEIGLMPKLFKTNPASLIILPSTSQKMVSLLNLSDNDIDFEIEYQNKMHFALDQTAGHIAAHDSVQIAVSPVADIPPGTFYYNFTVLFKEKEDIRLTVPVRIIKY